MGKFIIVVLFGFLFMPLKWVREIWEVLSFSVFGIPLWGLTILGLFFLRPRSKMKTVGTKPTNQKIMEGAALAALAHKLIKKPVLNFKDPRSKIIEEKLCLNLSWDIKISFGDTKKIDTTNISKITRSSSFAGGFTVDWVDISLDDLPESSRKIAYLALGIEK